MQAQKTATFNPASLRQKQPVVLQLVPELRSGGVERGTIDMARAIAQAGWTSLVASGGGPMAAGLAPMGTQHITLNLKSKSPLSIWSNSLALAKLIRKHKVDIVHARSRAPAWSGWLATRHGPCHFMTTFHGTYGLQNTWKQRYNSVMVKGERIIAVSHFIAQHIQQHYAVEPERLRVIHRGVDLRLFNPHARSAQRMFALEKEWRLPEDMPPLILFPRRITRWKGQDVFIKALAKLPHRHFFAVILGDDKGHESYRKELEKLIVDAGLEGHVRMAGHTQYISEAYMLARLVVATSIEPEAFGRVVLEAQAMGRPVIATRHGGAQETVMPDVTGWLVKPGDVEELATTMDYALSLSEQEVGWVGEQGMANAERFSLETMCGQTLGVYRELLQA